MDLAKSSFKAFSLKILGAVLFIVYSIFLARILSQGEYGVVMLAISVLTALGPLCLLGFDRTTTKFAAVYYAEKQIPLLRGLLARARRTGLGFSFALLLISGLLVVLGALNPAESRSRSILLAVCILPLWSWVILNREFQRGLKLLAPALVGFQILRPLLAMIFTAIAFVSWKIDATWSVVFLGLALLIVIAIDSRQINRVLGATDKRVVYESAKWLRTAKPLLFSMVMYTVMTRADMLMVGYILGVEEAARYAVAARLAAIPDFILDAIRVVMAPLVSEYFHKDNLALMQQQVSKASRWVFMAILPFAGSFIFFPKFFLGFFGKTYESANMILVYLIIGQCVNALSGTVGVLMTMTNLQKEHARIVSVGAVLFVIMCFVLIKWRGAEGAALATALTMSLSNIWMIFVVKRKLGIVSYMQLGRVASLSHEKMPAGARSKGVV